MKVLGFLFAGMLVLLGLLFCLSALTTGKAAFWIFAGILIAAACLIIFFIRMKVPEQKINITQRVDISGDVSLEEMNCRNCGASLDSKSVSVAAGAVFVKCPFCESQYQIEEAPKW